MLRALTFFLAVTAVLAADLAGTYKGSYSGSAGASGAFQITLAQSGSDWKAEVTFNLGDDVKAKVTSVQVDGSKIKVVYQFELQGTTLESTATAELKGDKFDGTYTTKSIENRGPLRIGSNGDKFDGTYTTKSIPDGSPVDQGAWNATRQ